MQKAQNIVFVLIVCVALVSVFAYRAYYAAMPGKSFPEVSAMEKRNYKTLDDVLAKSFVNGNAQKVFEQYVADGVPKRNEILLFNAGLQRQGIKTAATLMQYDAYPTFFGSNTNVCESGEFLVRTSVRVPEESPVELDAMIETFNKAAADHPDLRFSCRFVLETIQSEANPTYKLVSGNKVDSDWTQTNIVDRLDPALNAAVDPIESIDEISQEWLSTDNHWTLKRALRTYNSIADQLGLAPVTDDRYIEVVPEFYGSLARVGLDKQFTSNLEDLPTDFSNLQYYVIKNDTVAEKPVKGPDKRTATLAKKDHTLNQANEYQGYTTYYEAFNGLIVNNGKNNGRTCLMIGDSLTHCLKRYIAANYEKTYCIMPGNFTTKASLEKMIEKCKPDDVIMITQCMKYAMYGVQSPQFIGLDKNYKRKSDFVDDLEL